MNQFPNPSLLLHPNIPKPLHGVNPRTIKGNAWWDQQKNLSKLKYGNRCYACEVSKYDALFHQWLEAHEHYEVDYDKGRMRILDIVALCHACHNFIHNGRLIVMAKRGEEGRTVEQAYSILHRGFKILTKALLHPNPFALWSALSLTEWCKGHHERFPDWAETSILRAQLNKHPLPAGNDVDWGDWRLEFEGALYKPQFPTMEAWARQYGHEVRETKVVIGRRSQASNFDEYLEEQSDSLNDIELSDLFYGGGDPWWNPYGPQGS